MTRHGFPRTRRLRQQRASQSNPHTETSACLGLIFAVLAFLTVIALHWKWP